MNISQILQKTYKLFKEAKIKSPLIDAEILLAFVLKKNREFLLTHPEYKLSKLQITNYKLLLSQRLKNWPIAYLIGHKEFFGLDFFVNKDVLIPRPETELMVEEALRITRNMKHVSFIDVGTGSGCIIISLAKNIKDKKIKFIGIDISEKSLKVARKNAKLNKVEKQIKFIQNNLLSNLNKSKILNPKSKIIILANLPYLTHAQIKKSPSISKEPKSALVGGQDGLKYYQKLFKQINYLTKKIDFKLASNIYMICEIDPSQTKAIKKLATKELILDEILIKKDYSGKNRFAIINAPLPG